VPYKLHSPDLNASRGNSQSPSEDESKTSVIRMAGYNSSATVQNSQQKGYFKQNAKERASVTGIRIKKGQSPAVIPVSLEDYTHAKMFANNSMITSQDQFLPEIKQRAASKSSKRTNQTFETLKRASP